LAVPFYGYAPISRVSSGQSSAKDYDIIHVAHNWWRWRDVSGALLPGLNAVRHEIGRIAFVGSWWDAPPAGARDLGLDGAFSTDPDLLSRTGIELLPPVPYTDVVPLMSRARINVMTQRPLFRHLGLLTSKYFEIFAADTIPLVLLEPDEAELVYGPAGRELALLPEISVKLLDALHRRRHYCEVVEAVRQHLEHYHSYEVRVRELVEALKAPCTAARAGLR